MEPMTIREYLTKKVEIATERRVKREYKNIIKAEQEKMIAEQEKRQKKTVLNLHAKGLSVEDIADVLSIPLELVHETLEK
jgi:DNA-directed RNA polymerase specialized sigma24 family protein